MELIIFCILVFSSSLKREKIRSPVKRKASVNVKGMKIERGMKNPRGMRARGIKGRALTLEAFTGRASSQLRYFGSQRKSPAKKMQKETGLPI